MGAKPRLGLRVVVWPGGGSPIASGVWAVATKVHVARRDVAAGEEMSSQHHAAWQKVNLAPCLACPTTTRSASFF